MLAFLLQRRLQNIPKTVSHRLRRLKCFDQGRGEFFELFFVLGYLKYVGGVAGVPEGVVLVAAEFHAYGADGRAERQGAPAAYKVGVLLLVVYPVVGIIQSVSGWSAPKSFIFISFKSCVRSFSLHANILYPRGPARPAHQSAKAA